jgi:hypothetical protein
MIRLRRPRKGTIIRGAYSRKDFMTGNRCYCATGFLMQRLGIATIKKLQDTTGLMPGLESGLAMRLGINVMEIVKLRNDNDRIPWNGIADPRDTLIQFVKDQPGMEWA